MSQPAVQRVVGRYALFGEIASGGMATVHFGRLLGEGGFSRTVAIKRLHRQFLDSKDFVDMLMDEARIASRVQHPNVVQTIDVISMDQELCLVMEYVLGENLQHLVENLRTSGERMPLAIVGAIIAGALDGLHAAHEATDEHGTPLELVHRDISPQNILVGKDGVPRVLDFGIAKATGRVHSTKTGQFKGKLSYMPREQLRAKGVDHRADIYAAGLVLWELLVGRPAVDGETDLEVYTQVLEMTVPAPSQFRPDLSPEVDQVLQKACAPLKEDRYDSAHDFAMDVERVLGTASRRKLAAYVEQNSDGLVDREAQMQAVEAVSASRLYSAIQSGVPIIGATFEELVPTGIREAMSHRSSQLPKATTGSRTGPALAPTAAESVSPGRPSTTAVADEASERKRRGGGMLLVGIAALVAAIVVAVGFFLTRPRLDGAGGAERSAPAQAAGDPSGAPLAAEAEPSTAEPAATAAEPPVLPAASAPASATAPEVPAPKPTPRPRYRWRPRPRPRPQPEPAPAPALAPAPAANCDPPYVVNPDGTRRFKAECL